MVASAAPLKLRKRIQFIVNEDRTDPVLLAPNDGSSITRDASHAPEIILLATSAESEEKEARRRSSSSSSSSLFFVPSSIPCCLLYLGTDHGCHRWGNHHGHLVDNAMESFSQPRLLLHCHGSVGLSHCPWERCAMQQGLLPSTVNRWELDSPMVTKKLTPPHLQRRHKKTPPVPCVVRFPISHAPVTVVSLLRKHSCVLLDARRTYGSGAGKRRKTSFHSLADIYVDFSLKESGSSASLNETDSVVSSIPPTAEVGELEPPQSVHIQSDLQQAIPNNDLCQPDEAPDSCHRGDRPSDAGTGRCSKRVPPCVVSLGHLATSLDELDAANGSSMAWISLVPLLESPHQQQQLRPDGEASDNVRVVEDMISDVESGQLFSFTEICFDNTVDPPHGTTRERCKFEAPTEEEYCFEFLCVWNTLQAGAHK